MKKVHRRILIVMSFVVGVFALVNTADVTAERDRGGAQSESIIKRGLAISPVPLDLDGKNRAMVAQGSYIVNTSGCNDCHTIPEFEAGGNPFLGEPEQINVAGYLAGGRAFVPFVSRNLTPNWEGLPAGLTLEEFVLTLRTGEDLKNIPPSDLLQVMPWPVVGKHTDSNLEAIYEYLRAIPCLEDVPVEGGPPGYEDRC